MKLSTNPKLWLDVAILDMSNLTQNTKLEDLQKRISLLESGDVQRVVNTSPYNTPPSPVKKTEVMKPIKQESQQVKVTEQVSTLSEEDVLTDSVPMSKSAAPNALKTSWAKLLENISSFPSRAILKQQAIPVVISESEIILSIKNPSWLKQFGPEGSKYSSIVEAVNKMYPTGAKKIIIRAPESGDEALRKENNNSSDDEKPAPAQISTMQTEPEITKEEVVAAVEAKTEVDEADDSNEDIDNSNPQKSSSSKSGFHSDTVNNVMELFEGKIIE